MSEDPDIEYAHELIRDLGVKRSEGLQVITSKKEVEQEGGSMFQPGAPLDVRKPRKRWRVKK